MELLVKAIDGGSPSLSAFYTLRVSCHTGIPGVLCTYDMPAVYISVVVSLWGHNDDDQEDDGG